MREVSLMQWYPSSLYSLQSISYSHSQGKEHILQNKVNTTCMFCANHMSPLFILYLGSVVVSVDAAPVAVSGVAIVSISFLM